MHQMKSTNSLSPDLVERLAEHIFEEYGTIRIGGTRYLNCSDQDDLETVLKDFLIGPTSTN
jgi:hypothetical protein